MGGRGSTRWHGYHKAALVEETIDIVALGRAGVLTVVGKRASVITSKAAIHDHFKTGHREPSGTGF
jgi:hypothetical protein